MSWVRIWIHIVFSTKNRQQLLTDKVRYQVFEHIRKNAKEKNIWLDEINGWIEHCHCLIRLSREQSISKVAQLIKGESSFWINKNSLIENFLWQDDYFAVSVSESNVEIIKNYIRKQEEHHRRNTFQEEFDEFRKKYQF